MAPTERSDSPVQQQRRSFWLKTLHEWHWISSALCLIGLLLFAATGITLNHASQIEAEPVTTTKELQLPESVLSSITREKRDGEAPLPRVLSDWLAKEMSVTTAHRIGEWSDDELYVALPRPGGDAWLSVDLSDGLVSYEKTDRGWISYFNDLHKGRNTGTAWSWFLDVFAVACFVFAGTGLFLLQLHGGNRPLTWPVVGLGVIVPLVLAALFIH